MWKEKKEKAAAGRMAAAQEGQGRQDACDTKEKAEVLEVTPESYEQIVQALSDGLCVVIVVFGEGGKETRQSVTEVNHNFPPDQHRIVPGTVGEKAETGNVKPEGGADVARPVDAATEEETPPENPVEEAAAPEEEAKKETGLVVGRSDLISTAQQLPVDELEFEHLLSSSEFANAPRIVFVDGNSRQVLIDLWKAADAGPDPEGRQDACDTEEEPRGSVG